MIDFQSKFIVMNKEKAKKIISKYEELVVVCTYNMLFTNDIVCGLFIDAKAKVEKTDLYRFETKQLINKCEKKRKEYEKLINGIIGNKDDFFANANDVFCDGVNRHLQTLYYSIKQEFDKHSIHNSDVIASLELARTMCDFSCAQYKKRITTLREQDPQFKKFNMEYLELREMLHYLNEVMRSMCIPVTVDLNTESCTRAINILSNKLADVDIIAKAISA